MIGRKIIQYVGNLFLLSWIFSFALNCSAQDNLDELTSSLVQKERIDSSDLYLKFSKLGKEAIPYLINVIDKEEMGFVGFQDFNSSTLYPIHFNCVGIRAAYMVDYILANKNNQRLFNYCVIVKVIDNKSIMQPLTYDDMRSIKALYKDWWEKNKLKSIVELTEDWNNNKRPLTNSEYAWK